MARTPLGGYVAIGLLLVAARCLLQSRRSDEVTFVGPSAGHPAGYNLRAASRVQLKAAGAAELMSKTSEIVARHFGVAVEEVKPESTLNELGADSLDVVEVVMSLEEQFDVELPDEELTKLRTVQDAVDLISSKMD
eukprot:TRINITY_DN121911_c0_g1_i1.p2 TRINITY_DN121911_c0_g1~~TRINITY_DN121911_c0_g1_i1.p2  ORF type:complete len:136 (-),score=41.21 TRINITY_DN121911_c0_g1_i1:128-535(-)